MAYLWSVASAVPPYLVTAEDTKREARRVFKDAFPRGFAAFDRLVDNTHVRRRFLSRPVEDLLCPRDVGVTADWYARAAPTLAATALRRALEDARTAPDEVDAIVVSSATGHLIPAVDAYLVNELGLPRSLRRVPLATLGCAGGVAGLAFADELVAAGHRTVAVVAVETPSLTFRPGDRSMANIVSAAIFGDGAAAVVVRRDPPRGPSLRVRGARSWLHPDSYDAAGFKLSADGFRVVLDANLASLAARVLPEVVNAIALDACATMRDLSFYALHPGGTRVLEAIETALNLPRSATASAWHVLAEHGNMSSPTVLFVLAEMLRTQPPRVGAFGVLGAFGPGFAAEAVLVEAV